MANKGFVYRGKERTTETLKRKSSEGARDYDSCFKAGIPTYKPKEGENCVRIMPSTWDEPDWDYTIYSHYSVGADNARYLCLSKMKDEPCPVCEAALKATDEDEKDSLSVGKGAICWVIDRDNEKAGPQLWSIPFTKVRNEIHTRSIDKKTRAPILVDDPEEGYDIVFNRKGTDKTTQYTGVEVVRDPSPLHEDQKTQDRWLAYIEENPLPECLNFFEADYIEKVLFGKVSSKASNKEEAAGAAAEDETPPARTSRRGAAPPAEEGDAVADEAPPARTSRRALATESDEAPAPDSRAARRRALLADDDPPFDADAEAPAPARRVSRAAVEEETPVATARRSLERLKPRQ